MASQQTIDPQLTSAVTVSRLVGAVTVIDQQGRTHALEVGDQIQPGEQIAVTPNSGVMLLLPDGNLLPVGHVPALQSGAEESIASLEDQPVQLPLTRGDGEALVAKAETRADKEDTHAKHQPDDDKPVSSSITEESVIEMDLSQVNPEYTTQAFNAAGMDFADLNETTGYGKSVSSMTANTASGTASQPVFVNFSPVVIGDTAGTTWEDVLLVSTGKLQISDQNANDFDTVTLNSGKGAYGTLAIDQQGQWAYQLDNTNPLVQALGEGEHITEHFTVTVTDSYGASVQQQISITVDGTNDLPVISGVHAGTTSEGATQEVTGVLTQTDTDATDTHQWSVDPAHTAQHGSFTINQSGQWHYQLNNTDSAVNTLAHGQQLTETIMVKVADNHGGETTQQVTVVINGSNAAPVIGGTFTGSVIEDKLTRLSGSLTVADTDAGDTHVFGVANPQGSYGRLSVDASTGQWIYNLNHAKADGLSASEHRQETFTVNAIDNNGALSQHVLTIDVAGTNDRPVISSVTQKNAVEGGALVHGLIGALDIDHGDALTYRTASTVAGFSLNNDGSYSFDPKVPSYDHLKAGETQTLTIPVEAVDNHGGVSAVKDLVLTLTGTNDKAVITSTTVSVTEDTHQTETIQLGISDPDTGEAAFQTTSVPGAHGRATITATGQLVYTLDNAVVQHLNAGESITDTIKVTSVDGTTHDVSVTINGTNDNPVINAITAQSANEDGSKVTGQITSTDVDTGDTATYTTTATPAGFTLNSDGSYTLDPANAACQHLAAGETQTITVPVTATDSHGGTSTAQNLVITITGTNDTPVVSAPVVLPAGTEDLTQTITAAQLLANATDVDSTDTLSVQNVSVDHGTVTTDASGAIHFTPDPNYNGKVTLNYDVVDGNGGEVHTSASTNLAAVTDAAVITGQDTASLHEDSIANPVGGNNYDLTAHGKLDVVDPDAGESHFAHPAGNSIWYTGDHGGQLIIGPSGSWDYDMPNASKAVQQLGIGDTLVDTVTVRSADGTTHNIVVTIHGTNDIPVISSAVSLSGGKEDTDVTLHAADLLANATDVDSGETAQLSVKSLTAETPDGSSAGTITQNPDGSFNFHPAQDYNGAVNFNYDVVDPQGASASATATMNLAAVQDAAVITSPPVDVTEDTHQSATIQLSITDPDAGEAKFQTTPLTGAHGSATITADGQLVYTLDNAAAQHLNAGQSITDVITVTSVDGTTHDVSVTINGTNDKPVINAITAQSANEDGSKVSGQITSTDVDTGDHATYATTATPAGFTLNTDGTYSLDPGNAAYQHLGVGESQKITIPIIATDTHSGVSAPQNLVIILTGTNDAPTVSAPIVLAAGTEDIGQTITSAQLLANATDIDTNDKLSVAKVTVDHGSVTTDASGAIHYTPEPNYNGKVTFGYDVIDGNGDVVHTSASSDLAAVQDAAVITGQDTGGVIEDALGVNATHLLATGKLNISDVDAGEAQFQAHTFKGGIQGSYGTLSIFTDGRWSYSAENSQTAIQSLGKGETLVDTISVLSKDGTSHDIKVTITGTNDAPVISSAVSLAAGSEDHDVTLQSSDLLANASDIDHNDKGKLSVQNLSADHGTIVDNHDGTFTFHPEANYNSKVTFSYDVQDAHGGTVSAGASMDLAAVQDAATITSPVVDVTEDTHQTATIQLGITDPDAGEAKFQTTPLTGAHGSATITADGQLVYTLDNAATQHLNAGQSITDVIIVTSADGTIHDVSVTINGTNDNPVINAITAQSANEDGSKVSGQITSTDIDTGDSATYATTATPAGFTLNSDGSYTLDPANAAYQHLAAGETQTITVPVTATDSHGGASTARNLVITITGTNDTPLVSAPVVLPAGTEDLSQTITAAQLLANATDVDSTDTLSVQNVSVDHGTVTTDASGAIHFTPEPNYNGKVTFNYEVTDSHGGTIQTTASSTLASVADAGTVIIAAVTSDNIINAHESGSNVNVEGTATGGDIKAGDTVSMTINGNAYTTTVDASGHWAVPVAGADLVAQPGFSVDVVSTDGSSTVTSSASHTVNIDTSITATITVDSITTDNIINAAEAGGTVAVTGSVGGDVKDGDTVTLTIGSQTHTGTVSSGTFSIDVPGSELAASTSVGASVSTTDTAGNTATATNVQSYSVDTSATAGISVDSITPDNVINAAESGSNVNVTGAVTGDVKDGDTVTLSINGTDYSGTVSGGKYSIPVAGSDLKADSQVHASVTGTDAAGNSQTAIADHGYTVDTVATATIHLFDVTPDNILSASEAVPGGLIHITGLVGGDIKTGDTVTLSVGGHTYTEQVAGSMFIVDVPGSVLKAANSLTATITTTDAAGNTITATENHAYSVDTTAVAAISVDSITPDNIINAAESGGKVSVTGSVSGDAKDGDTVTLSVNGTDYTGAVSGGKYSIPVDGADLKADSSVHASITATDAAWNTITATADHSYTVDTDISATISLDPITADNILNATEASGVVAVTGSVGGDAANGDTVTLTVGGTNYTGTVDASGHFSVDVPGSMLDINNAVDASIAITDAAGNATSATASQSYSVDTNASAGITVDSITPDNVINAAESGGKVNVTGTVSGDVKDGDSVALTVNGNTVNGTVTGGKYSIAVDGADLKADSSVHASVTGTDAAGNSQTATADHAYTVDSSIVTLGVSLTTDSGVAGDLVTNDGHLQITGQETGAVVEYSVDGGHTWSNSFSPVSGQNTVQVRQTDTAGNTSRPASLSFTLDNAVSAPSVALQTDSGVSNSDHISNVGQLVVTATEPGAQISYSTDAGKSWSNTFHPAEGINHVLVRQTDVTGNTSASSNFDFTYDTTKPVVTLAHTPDSNQPTYTISGTASTDIDEINLQLTRGATTVTVHPHLDTSGNWHFTLPGATGDHHFQLEVSGIDKAGNTSLISRDSFTIDTGAQEPTVHFESTGSDKVYNANEVGTDGTITATIGLPGDAKAGDILHINGSDHSLTATDISNGNVTQEVAPGSKLSLSITDALGNTSTVVNATAATADLHADAGTVMVSHVTGDDILNAHEMGAKIAITGFAGTGDISPGDTATLNINGHSYTAQLQGAAGAFSFNVAPADLKAQPSFSVSVESTDAAGNPVTSTSPVKTVVIDETASAATDTDSVTEDTHRQTSGNVLSNDSDADHVTTTGTIAGKYGSFHLQADGSYTYTLDNSNPSVQQQAPSSKPLVDTIQYSVVDNHGNAATANLAVSVHGVIDAPTLTATHETTHFNPVTASAESGHHGNTLDHLSFSAFATQNIETAGKLDISAADKSLASSSRSGFGVASTTSPGALRDGRIHPEIETGETLLVHLEGEARGAVLNLRGFTPRHSGSIANDKAHWIAYDHDGNKVAEGDQMPSTDRGSNGVIDISTTKPFSYIALQAVDGPVSGTGARGTSRFDLESVEAKLISYDTKLDLAGSLTDTGGHEVLSYKVSGLDDRASLNHGVKNADGSWTVAAADVADLHLLHASDLNLSIVAIATDGSVSANSQAVNLSIAGNTASYELISGIHSGHTDEDNKLDLTGNLHIDASATTAHEFIAQTVTTAHGTFTINAQGHWTYHVNNAAEQKLNSGEYDKESFTVETNTGVKQQVDIDIRGRSDATILGGTAGSVTEDLSGHSSTTGQLTYTDVDSDISKITMGVRDYSGKYGTLHINQDGSWSYTLDHSKANSLAAGEIVHDTFKNLEEYVDGVFQSIMTGSAPIGAVDITIHGNNDRAVIAGADTASTVEGSSASVGGTLTVSDADHDQNSFQAVASQAGDNGYGHFSLSQNGQWQYVLDAGSAKLQALAAGARVQDTVQVHSADGTAHTLTVDIAGTNTTPVVQSATASGNVHEDDLSQQITSGQIVATDADGDSLQFSIDTAHQPRYGSMVVDSQGQWHYWLDNNNPNVNALNTGDQLQDTVRVKIDDGHGGLAYKDVTVQIAGSDDNHPAVIGGQDTGLTHEGDNRGLRGSLSISDQDSGEAVFQEETKVAGQYGHFSIGRWGDWTYHVDNNAANVKALTSRDHVTDSFTVQSKDGTSHQVTIAIDGADNNQAPVIHSFSKWMDRRGEWSGSVDATDADHDRLSYSLPNGNWSGNSSKGQFGTLTIDSHGNLDYKTDNHVDRWNMQRSGHGRSTRYSGTDSFEVQVSDGHGHTDTKYIQFEVRADRNGGHVEITSQHETDYAPRTVNDEALTDSDQSIDQVNIALDTADQQIATAALEIQELTAQGADTTDAQARLDALTGQVDELVEQQHALQDTPTPAVDEIVDDHADVAADHKQSTNLPDEHEISQTADHNGTDSSGEDLSSLVATDAPQLDFDRIAELSAHSAAASAEHPAVDSDATPLNPGDVLDTIQSGEADILSAVDNLDKSKPDAVEHPDKAGSTDGHDADQTGDDTAATDTDHAGDHAQGENAPDVMPDRSAMDAQLVEPPDEHQQ